MLYKNQVYFINYFIDIVQPRSYRAVYEFFDTRIFLKGQIKTQKPTD